MIHTIGHSNHPIERFVALLTQHSVGILADVRSTPFSRFNPQFNSERLRASLSEAGIEYLFLGHQLGARTEDASCYDCDGRVSYAKLAATSPFQEGIRKLIELAAQERRVVLMCAEREPLECHRTILVARELAHAALPVLHILADGSVEEHAHAIERLLVDLDLTTTDLFRDSAGLIEQAYDEQAKRIAYVRNPNRSVQ
ncbi:MAG TPA: DUF488 domain-containing protein [Steroidobacteraceae bacterium]|nr:DUF488 domain-containing protein [Steroidobacteraceae bacterium]